VLIENKNLNYAIVVLVVVVVVVDRVLDNVSTTHWSAAIVIPIVAVAFATETSAVGF